MNTSINQIHFPRSGAPQIYWTGIPTRPNLHSPHRRTMEAVIPKCEGHWCEEICSRSLPKFLQWKRQLFCQNRATPPYLHPTLAVAACQGICTDVWQEQIKQTQSICDRHPCRGCPTGLDGFKDELEWHNVYMYE